MEENKKLFDSISAEDLAATEGYEPEELEQPQQETPEMVDAPDYEFGELSDKEKKDIILLEEDKEKVFVIETAELLKPRLIDAEGKPIPPQPFNLKKTDSKKGYQTKLALTYKDTKYLSLLPNVKWYPNTTKEGKKQLNPWFNTNVKEEQLDDKFTSVVSKLYFKYCVTYGFEPGKLTQAEFVQGLVGKKVKLVQDKTFYEGQNRFRLDIKEFVK